MALLLGYRSGDGRAEVYASGQSVIISQRIHHAPRFPGAGLVAGTLTIPSIGDHVRELRSGCLKHCVRRCLSCRGKGTLLTGSRLESSFAEVAGRSWQQPNDCSARRAPISSGLVQSSARAIRSGSTWVRTEHQAKASRDGRGVLQRWNCMILPIPYPTSSDHLTVNSPRRQEVPALMVAAVGRTSDRA